MFLFCGWYWITVLFLASGPRCWRVWGLLSAADWNGAATAISDQEDCWHQPSYPTSCLWPFLVLLSVWGKLLNLVLNRVFFISFSVFTTLKSASHFSSVSDDPADPVCQEASEKAFAVHLRLQRKISSAAGSAHSGLPCAQHQEASGGAGHLPPGWRGHSHVWFSSAVRHAHQSGEEPLGSCQRLLLPFC